MRGKIAYFIFALGIWIAALGCALEPVYHLDPEIITILEVGWLIALVGLLFGIGIVMSQIEIDEEAE